MTPALATLPVEDETKTSARLVSFFEVSKAFDPTRPVLDRVSLEAGAGEFVSLIGPSGCGKSTLLKLMAGLTKATAGTISIAGLPPERARALTSFVFQDATLLPWRTASRNIELALEFESVPKIQRRQKVLELLRLVDLEAAADLYPRQLSGGMKMRVSIARALVRSPRLLLMDEPFGALDEMTRNRLNEELLRIRQAQQWTAFFVTHSVAEAVFLSTRVAIMRANPGRIAREIEIDLPQPRTAALRQDRRYLDLCGRVSAALHEVHA